MTQIETARLLMREPREEDFAEAHKILGDAKVMYAWEHGFSEGETRAWIAENIARHRRDGFSYLAAFEKSSGELAGFIGPLVENINGESRVGVGYILKKKFWGCGLAAEGAAACLNYAFEHLGAEEAVATIRPENSASRKTAERLGMKARGSFVKVYKGKEMPHLIYSITREEWRERKNEKNART